MALGSVEPLFDINKNILPKRQLIVVLCALAFTIMVSFIDQTAIGIALPTIGIDLNAGENISWAGTSSLIASTVCQLISGRLSDVFGRKEAILTGIVFLIVGDLACGFAKTGSQLYAFRGISGVGNGAITALTNMFVSDFVLTKDRGKYQGILGFFIGFGNSIGPFFAAGYLAKATWKPMFWTISPLAFLAGGLLFFILPPTKTTRNTKQRIRTIDYLGMLLGSSGVFLILIPIAGGGTDFLWNSPKVISMLILGSVSMIAFGLVEWKVAALPLLPLHLFTKPTVCAILIQNFFVGIVYYPHLYYLPIYYQSTLQMSVIKSAGLVVPFVGAQAIASIASGQYVSRMNRYTEVIWTGYILWFIGSLLLFFLFNREINTYAIVLILIVEGAGVGAVFQPTLQAAYRHCKEKDRAIVVSSRNFIRALGGAAGLAISAAIFSNVLNAKTNSLPTHVQDHIRNEKLGNADLSIMNATEKETVLSAFASASHATFNLYFPGMIICVFLCFLIRHNKDKEEEVKEEEQLKEIELQERSTASSIPSDTSVTTVTNSSERMENGEAG